MLQLFGLLFACDHLKFKLPLITTTAGSWKGEQARLERSKYILILKSSSLYLE